MPLLLQLAVYPHVWSGLLPCRDLHCRPSTRAAANIACHRCWPRYLSSLAVLALLADNLTTCFVPWCRDNLLFWLFCCLRRVVFLLLHVLIVQVSVLLYDNLLVCFPVPAVYIFCWFALLCDATCLLSIILPLFCFSPFREFVIFRFLVFVVLVFTDWCGDFACVVVMLRQPIK